MKYTQIPANTFQNLQMNAGILVDGFTPATGVIGNIIGATKGGNTFSDSTSWIDMGSDIDNCPKNMKELKKLDAHEVTMSGTFLTVTVSTAKLLVGAADIDQADATHIVPRNDIEAADFSDVWWIGDYSDVNTGDSAGFIAIHLINALNTGGFQIKSTDREKGEFAFSFMGHYSMANQDRVPYELYVKSGSSAQGGSIVLNRHYVALTYPGDTVTLTAAVTPGGTSVTWTSGSNSVATVAGGVVTPAGAGNTIIRAAITVDGVTYDDTCTVVVTAAEE